ncbi:HAD family hydrolase, partial [Patescibacteria group bacterium]|nr:HAD family hydrolase [Patescibacteria group bacterium]
VELSNGRSGEKKRKETDLGKDVDLVILDIDDTLVTSNDPTFYKQYSYAVDRATARYLGVSNERGKEIADFYRKQFGDGALAILSGTIPRYFPEFSRTDIDVSVIYDEMNTINPTGKIESSVEAIELIQRIRDQGKRLVAVTDSPEELSRKILVEAGIDPDTIFDEYIPFRRKVGPLKMLQGGKIFSDVAEFYRISPSRILSVGDRPSKDLLPAQRLGMKTCSVGRVQPEGYSGPRAQNIYEALYRILGE